MDARRGPLVVFEGINFAGKTTQVSLMRAALEESGVTATYVRFPEYGTPLGRLVRQCMTGQLALPNEALLTLFAGNRLEFKDLIQSSLQRGRTVISDRYRESAFAYGAALGVSETWIRTLEAQMPAPSIVILLDLAPALAIRRAGTEHKLDVFERDVARLDVIRRNYLELARRPDPNTRWHTVDAAAAPDAIHASVLPLLSGIVEDLHKA